MEPLEMESHMNRLTETSRGAPTSELVGQPHELHEGAW